jgi:hypothetical protein
MFRKRDAPRFENLLALVGVALVAACSPTPSQPPSTATVAAPTVAPVVVVSPSSIATALPASPTTVARAGPTAIAPSVTVWVGETDGGGVYLRNSPHEGDRADVLPDGTPLTVTGDEIEGDGQRWYPVRTADGGDGFVQVIYTTRVEPSGPPALPQGQPK